MCVCLSALCACACACAYEVCRVWRLRFSKEALPAALCRVPLCLFFVKNKRPKRETRRPSAHAIKPGLGKGGNGGGGRGSASGGHTLTKRVSPCNLQLTHSRRLASVSCMHTIHSLGWSFGRCELCAGAPSLRPVGLRLHARGSLLHYGCTAAGAARFVREGWFGFGFTFCGCGCCCGCGC